MELKGVNVTVDDSLNMVTMRVGLLDSIKRKLRAVKLKEIRIQMNGGGTQQSKLLLLGESIIIVIVIIFIFIFIIIFSYLPRYTDATLRAGRVGEMVGISFDVQPYSSPDLIISNKLRISLKEPAHH